MESGQQQEWIVKGDDFTMTITHEKTVDTSCGDDLLDVDFLFRLENANGEICKFVARTWDVPEIIKAITEAAAVARAIEGDFNSEEE